MSFNDKPGWCCKFQFANGIYHQGRNNEKSKSYYPQVAHFQPQGLRHLPAVQGGGLMLDGPCYSRQEQGGQTAAKIKWRTCHAHPFRSTSERRGAHMYHLFADEIVEDESASRVTGWPHWHSALYVGWNNPTLPGKESAFLMMVSYQHQRMFQWMVW